GLETTTNSRERGLQEKGTTLRLGTRHLLKQKVDSLASTHETIRGAIDRCRQGKLNLLKDRLSRFQPPRFFHMIALAQAVFATRQKHLSSTSHEAILRRGYSLTRDQSGRLIRTIHNVQNGQRIVTQLSDGNLESIVDHIGERQ